MCMMLLPPPPFPRAACSSLPPPAYHDRLPLQGYHDHAQLADALYAELGLLRAAAGGDAVLSTRIRVLQRHAAAIKLTARMLWDEARFGSGGAPVGPVLAPADHCEPLLAGEDGVWDGLSADEQADPTHRVAHLLGTEWARLHAFRRRLQAVDAEAVAQAAGTRPLGFPSPSLQWDARLLGRAEAVELDALRAAVLACYDGLAATVGKLAAAPDAEAVRGSPPCLRLYHAIVNDVRAQQGNWGSPWLHAHTA